ncbi:MAG: SLAC1 anion channel family protein [Quisquiliibacterium sp.]|jgi:tellurite resistance protein
MSTAISPAPTLASLGPQWFAPTMGWGGLALAWHRAGERLGPVASQISLACLLVAAIVFTLVLLASLARISRHPRALREDFSHPVRHGFVAAFPISILILSTTALLHGAPPDLIEPVWLFALALQFAVSVWIVARWIGGRVAWSSITPILYIPMVGNILVPLAGVPLGHTAIAWVFFGIGAFFWPVLTALVLARLAHQPLPDRLMPTWFITIAPPAVGGLSAISLGMTETLLPAALGLAVLSAAACAVRLPVMLKGEFAMPAWAVSFPLAALSALTLRSAPILGAAGTLGIALLAITTIVIIGLTLATLKGLRSGLLLSPEPVAPPVVAKA